MNRPMTDDERDLLTHVTMWGSDGYPITKLRRGWTWSFRSNKGPPVVYATKRACVAQFEAFVDVLRGLRGAECFAARVAECRAAGWSEERISASIYAERGHAMATAESDEERAELVARWVTLPA